MWWHFVIHLSLSLVVVLAIVAAGWLAMWKFVISKNEIVQQLVRPIAPTKRRRSTKKGQHAFRKKPMENLPPALRVHTLLSLRESRVKHVNTVDADETRRAMLQALRKIQETHIISPHPVTDVTVNQETAAQFVHMMLRDVDDPKDVARLVDEWIALCERDVHEFVHWLAVIL